MNERENFIAALYPAARQASRETGMSLELILAQAAHETGWGQRQLPGTNNIFNIKADGSWKGGAKTFNVWEMEGDKKVWRDEPFRVYDSYEEALRDRTDFLRRNPRYAKAGLFDDETMGDLRKEAVALQKAGYATDKDYADRLVKIFNGPTMQRAIQYAQMIEQASKAPHQPMRQGARGADVSALQSNLATLGYSDHRGHPLQADGHYGPATKSAVMAFQSDHQLKSDGIVGEQTKRALEEQLGIRYDTPALAPELQGPPSIPVDRLAPTNRRPTNPERHERAQFESPTRISNPFADPTHRGHGIYVELKERIPDASENRLAQMTVACHTAGIRPGQLGDIHIGRNGILLRPEGLGSHAVVDNSIVAPPIEQSLQQMDAYDKQQAVIARLRSQELSQEHMAPMMGAPHGTRMG